MDYPSYVTSTMGLPAIIPDSLPVVMPDSVPVVPSFVEPNLRTFTLKESLNIISRHEKKLRVLKDFEQRILHLEELMLALKKKIGDMELQRGLCRRGGVSSGWAS
ncbi:hypothetical protein LSH36_463g00007 [Paralvinella palmiformis]|uniref:Uncharacterized protein n=1 Tax=Paralvinella palmiformis TaxID=53620 RepID=A0AAD9MX85_9ANNE|nr:hypothetical protein LSH36_463g00007 [Paralvinella palmiformis]